MPRSKRLTLGGAGDLATAEGVELAEELEYLGGEDLLGCFRLEMSDITTLDRFWSVVKAP